MPGFTTPKLATEWASLPATLLNLITVLSVVAVLCNAIVVVAFSQTIAWTKYCADKDLTLRPVCLLIFMCILPPGQLQFHMRAQVCETKERDQGSLGLRIRSEVPKQRPMSAFFHLLMAQGQSHRTTGNLITLKASTKPIDIGYITAETG